MCRLTQVVAEATGALEWLEEKQKLQDSLRPTDDPVLLASDIAKREGTPVRFAEPILNKPAPPPPKVHSNSASSVPFDGFVCLDARHRPQILAANECSQRGSAQHRA